MTPELLDADAVECCCATSDWCKCSSRRGKAKRHNASVRQALKLGVLGDIDERSYGVWLVRNDWYWHPNSRLGRPRQRGAQSTKFSNFASFWSHINR